MDNVLWKGRVADEQVSRRLLGLAAVRQQHASSELSCECLLSPSFAACYTTPGAL